MQFAIIARDNPEPGTLARRLACREAHLERARVMKAEGTIIDGGAILNEAGEMVGSVILCEFPDHAALDAYLASEVYVREGVWQDIEILPFRRVPWHA